MTALGYLRLDRCRLRLIEEAEARHGEVYEGFRVLPRETAAERVRRELADDPPRS